MIQTVRKIVTIGSSYGVTLPPKDMERDNLKLGDKVEIIVRPIRDENSHGDQAILKAAKKILNDYKQDFKNLAKR